MSDKKVLTYAPSLVKVKLFGLAMEGFSPDGVADIERQEGATTFRKAMDGSRTAFVDRYATYRVSVHLLQTSPTNTWLHQLYKLYQKAGIEFKMPISIEDKSSGREFDTFSATDVFFDEEPSTNYTSQSEVTTWTFICHDGNYNRMGSADTYEVAEKLQYLFSALSTAESLGINLESIKDTTSQMLDTLSETVFSKF